jgi:Zn-dependent protease with chaperone function
MDFFAHQDRARRNTSLLAALFALAVLAIIAAVFAVTQVIFVASGTKSFDWALLGYVATGTLIVVGGGSIYRVLQLRAGGKAVATMLGARPLTPGTTDRLEMQLRNVVEETAIASGVPVPGIWIMDRETGINAFAAGYASGDAVVAVTRGCLEQLDRDELQGVVAHEFSHVLNGDMRLNIRLIGLLHGILCIALAGYILLRSGLHGGRTSSRGKGGGGAMAILAFGAALVAIGWIGVFFAKLVKAAVSRQREFLADAAAVQFTRNPKGLAGALQKIADHAGGSRLQTAQAEAASHMFFGNALRAGLFAAFATHPPLEERIRRIAGRMPDVAAPRREPAAPAAAGVDAAAAGLAAGAALAPEAFVASVGQPGHAHLQHARTLLEELPLGIAAAVREPFSARAVIYGLLLDADPVVRREQMQALQEREEPAALREAIELAPRVKQLGAAARLPLVDVALPALRQMSQRQYERFADNVRSLIAADRQLTLFELTLQRVLLRHLASAFGRAPVRGPRHDSLAPLRDECALVLSALARAGHDNDDAVAAAFRAGAAHLPLGGEPLARTAQADLGIEALGRALDRLAFCTPARKKDLLRACAQAVAHDRQVWPWEAEILRAVADTLDCPVPPLPIEGSEPAAPALAGH